MQITMTRFSGKTLIANRNVDVLRLRGSQGTPAGTFELYVMRDLSDQNEHKYLQQNFMSDRFWGGRTVSLGLCIFRSSVKT